jgi:hypothetical protein
VLLGPIVPTGAQHFSPPGLSKYRGVLDPVSAQYLGVPLVLLVALLSVWFRRNRGLLLAVSLGIIAFVLSLGLRLVVLNRPGSIPLPYVAISRVSWLNNILPERLSLYVALFVAVAVGLGISATLTASTPSDGTGRYQGARTITYRRLSVAVLAGLAALALIALIPSWPYASAPSSVPYFFRSGLSKVVPSGSTILTYPFPQFPQNQAMAWDAVSGMRFKETGGYAIFRTATGRASPYPGLLPPTSVQGFLTYEEHASGASAGPGISDSRLVADIRSYISNYHIAAVIIELTDTGLPRVPNVAYVVAVFTRALGAPVVTGGVALWLEPRN